MDGNHLPTPRLLKSDDLTEGVFTLFNRYVKLKNSDKPGIKSHQKVYGIDNQISIKISDW